MWIRTQDGKTTINVDRFTVESKVKNGVNEGEKFSKKFESEEKYRKFNKDNPDLVEVDHIEDTTYGLWDGYNKVIKATYIKPVRVGVITCGDVVLGEYSSLKKAEKVRDDMEKWLKDDAYAILHMPQDESVNVDE